MSRLMFCTDIGTCSAGKGDFDEELDSSTGGGALGAGRCFGTGLLSGLSRRSGSGGGLSSVLGSGLARGCGLGASRGCLGRTSGFLGLGPLGGTEGCDPETAYVEGAL